MDKNIVWSKSSVEKTDREKIFKQKGMIVWLSGLSGSGKSTIGHIAECKLTSHSKLTYFLDGDNLRFGLNSNLGFSLQDRAENVRRIGEAAILLANCGVIVIVGAVSPLKSMRDAIRQRALENNIPFGLAYVKADVDACALRDPKGLYKKAFDGEIKDFTGISSPYEIPENPELVLDTLSKSPEECAFNLFTYINKFQYDSEKVLKTCIKAAIEAGKLIMEVYNSADFDVEYKDDHSPLTRADKYSNSCIIEHLQREFPNYSILTEECIDETSRLCEDFCFIVDPLDGTKEFLKKNDEFTVNIALSYLGKSILGVIYVPATHELYYACDNRGAYLNSHINNPEEIDLFSSKHKITVSNKTDNLIVMASRSHSDEKTLKMLEDNKAKIKETISAGSSLKGCYIACGKTDIYYRFGLTCEWDTAAMQIIVEEAGGIFRQLDDTAMTYNRKNTLNEKGFYILNRNDNKFKL